MAKKEKKQKDDSLPENSATELLTQYLKDNEEDHYNFQDSIYYRVSTGSLTWDIETGGGLMPGLHRFCGINEGGKTSAMLECMRNFLIPIKGRRGFLVKAEGRLSKEMQIRSGIKFVYKAEDWVDGTCFVFECNIFETVFELIKRLIQENAAKINYFFGIDSVDGLQLKDDSTKGFDEASKVAGGALLSSVFLKKVNIAMEKFGHICALISQVRSEVKIDPYAKTILKQTSATGGNALLHYANFIFEFEPHSFKDDLILEKEGDKPDRIKNKIIGHWVKITIKKSPNEKTNLVIKYPVRYARTNGTSVWIEREILDALLQFDLAKAAGAWIKFDENLTKEFKDLPPQVNGQNKFYELMDSNNNLVMALYNKFKSILIDSNEAKES